MTTAADRGTTVDISATDVIGRATIWNELMLRPVGVLHYYVLTQQQHLFYIETEHIVCIPTYPARNKFLETVNS
jgi:hypothetical protein